MSSSPRLQTPRAKVSYLGSARSGTQTNWLMRLTSFALLPLTIAFILIALSLAGRDYASAHQLLGSACPAILLLLFVGMGVYHMVLGMKMIIEDYIPIGHGRELALLANISFGLVIGVSLVYAILRLSFT